MNKFRLKRGSTYSIHTLNCKALINSNALIYGAYKQSDTPTITNPQEIKFVGEASNNIYNPINITENYYIAANSGSKVYKEGWYCSDFFSVKPSTTYTIVYPRAVSASQAGLSFYDIDKNILPGGKDTTEQGAVYTFTTSSTCQYIIFSWKASGNIIYPKIALGTTTVIDDYYSGYKIPITINGVTKNVYLSEPLRQVDSYCDYIDLANQKVVRYIKKIQADQLTFSRHTTVLPYISYKVSCAKAAKQIAMSNKFIYYQFVGTVLGKECVAVGSDLVTLYFVMNNDTSPTYEEIIKDCCIYYPLETPMKETLNYILDTDHIESISIGTSLQPSKIETVTVAAK